MKKLFASLNLIAILGVIASLTISPVMAAISPIPLPMRIKKVPPMSFVKNIGTTTFFQEATFVQQTTDNGYIVAGSADSAANGFDMYLARLDVNGSYVNTFGTNGIRTISRAGYQQAFAVKQLAGGGYIVAGNDGDAADGDIMLVKLNANGNLDNSFGTNGIVTIGGANYQEFHAMEQTSDGGYIVAGFTMANGGDIYVAKLNTNGSLDTTFGVNGSVNLGGTGNQMAFDIRHTTDGGYIIAGQTSANNMDMLVAKIDQSGNLITSFGTNGIKLIGSTGEESARSIIQTVDNNYTVAGYSSANGFDMYLARLDINGNLITSFGTNGTRLIGDANHQMAKSIQSTTDGNYIVAGQSVADGMDAYIAKVNFSGSLVTSFGTNGIKTFGGAGYQELNNIQKTTDGGYVAVGKNDAIDNLGDMYVAKIDSYGNYSKALLFEERAY